MGRTAYGNLLARCRLVLDMASNKVWFITGTSRGFGREWAIAALERGDRVAATARDVSSLDELVAKYDRDADFHAVATAHEHLRPPRRRPPGRGDHMTEASIILFGPVVVVALVAAIAGLVQDRAHRGERTELLLRNGLFRLRTLALWRYFRDVGDSA